MSVAQLALAGAFIIPRAAACAFFETKPLFLMTWRSFARVTPRPSGSINVLALTPRPMLLQQSSAVLNVAQSLWLFAQHARYQIDRAVERQSVIIIAFTGIEHMPIQLDPEEHEITALVALLPNLHQSRVVEVGCGDGRLTRRYAARAASVLAFDPDEVSIAAVRSSSLAGDVELRTATVESVDIPEGSADVVLLSWAL